MPGKVAGLDDESVWGVAWHPEHRDYFVTVHAVLIATVFSSQVTSQVDGQPTFRLKLPRGYRPAHLRVMIGETREILTIPRPPHLGSSTQLVVEDLLFAAFDRQPLAGKCDVDAERSQMFYPEDIVELLCYDILGHKPDLDLVRAGVGSYYHEDRTYTAFRRQLLALAEGHQGRRIAERAAGAVFDSPLAWGISPRASRVRVIPKPKQLDLTSQRCLEMGADEFVRECCDVFLGQDAPLDEIIRHQAMLEAGLTRERYVVWLAAGRPPELVASLQPILPPDVPVLP